MDGCAILFKKSRFVLVEKHALEFNHVAMSRARWEDRDVRHHVCSLFSAPVCIRVPFIAFRVLFYVSFG